MPFMTTKSSTRTPSDFSHTQKLPSVTLREKGNSLHLLEHGDGLRREGHGLGAGESAVSYGSP